MGRTESDEIDSLVEEELSRNESEHGAQKDQDDFNSKLIDKPSSTSARGVGSSSKGATPTGANAMMRVQISTKSITAEHPGSGRGGGDADSLGGSSTGSGAESSS